MTNATSNRSQTVSDTPFPTKLSQWHISVAAEAIAAAQFARHGFDVSVQYGADQPEYDLIVAKGDRLMKISVKGSQDWGWGLTQSYIAAANKKSGKKANYHGAIELWLERHSRSTVFCFVQFGGVAPDQMPRLYLATPVDVATRLHESSKGRGDSILYERWEWTKRAHGAGTTDEIPASWRFSAKRIHELLTDSSAGLIVDSAPHMHEQF
jgi:Holliday junction resolvase-like predicted endonuclease